MIAVQKIRDNQSLVEESISKKGESISLDNIIRLDSELRDLTKKLNDLQSEQNKKSKEIGKLKSENSEDELVFSDLKKLSKDIKELERLGTGKLFGPGTPIDETLNYITNWVNENRR